MDVAGVVRLGRAAQVARLGDASTLSADGEPKALTWPRPDALLLGVLAGALLMSEGALMDWSALYLMEDLGTTATIAAAGYAAFAFGTTSGRLCGDHLNSAVGSGRLMRGGCLLSALTLGLMLAVGEPAIALPALALIGFALSNALPLVFSAAGRLSEGGAGSALAAVTTTGYLGLLAGPPLLGFVAQATGLPEALGLTAILIASVSIFAPYVRVSELRPAAGGGQS